MKSCIRGIGTSTPGNRLAQSDILGFMVRAHDLHHSEARQLEVLYRASGIHYRHSVLPDYGREPEYFEFYPRNARLAPFPPISRRMEKYREEALPLCLEALRNLRDTSGMAEADLRKATHLITVSCTGMYAPGLDIELMERLGLSPSVERTAINFMGCHAAINALKVADNICRAEPAASVLIFCVELCTLHFQNSADDDNLLANALFADGAAAVWMTASEPKELSLSPVRFLSAVNYAGKNDMAWQIGDHGFEMKLSAYVPGIIRGGIGGLTAGLVENGEMLPGADYFAVHPGGKRILEAVEEALGISREKNRAAYDVLRNYGNMSSPTVLFVIKELWKGLSAADDGKKILSFAFGPGLTMESMLLEVNGGGNA